MEVENPAGSETPASTDNPAGSDDKMEVEKS